MKNNFMLSKKGIIFLLFGLTLKVCLSQETFDYEPGVLWVNVKDESAKLTSQNRTANTSLNDMFDDFNVTSYIQILYFAKNPLLRNVYEIKCNCDEGALMDSLNKRFSNLFLPTEKK